MTHSPHSPILDRYFHRYLAQEDPARFIADVADRYSIQTLHRLAEYGQRMTRRGATMALGFLADYDSNDVVGRRMNDDDRGVRLIAENGIRNLWHRDGNEDLRLRLEGVVRLVRNREYQPAIREATRLIEDAAWFAEAWNQRAVAHFHLARYLDSSCDCHQALELNPYHYAAAVGMAHCFLEMDNPHAALESFRRALRLNPDLEDVRLRASYLSQAIKDR